MAKKGLGRGLDALLADNAIDESQQNGITMLKLSDIEPNRGQARKQFDEAALLELSDSISKHGILQPVTVRKKSNGYYEIIAGERRWRASKIAGLNEIPALIKDVDDKAMTELSLIENLQRENLNPVEEARGYSDLMDRFSLTQEEAAERVGKSRTAVANIIRLLKLPNEVLDYVEDEILSCGHARTLIPLVNTCDKEALIKHAEYIAKNALSVRQTEQYVKTVLNGRFKKTDTVSPVAKAYYKKLENDISDSLGRKTTINQSSDGKGKLIISFNGSDDLEELIKTLCGNQFFNNDN